MFDSRTSIPFTHEAFQGFIQCSGRMGLDNGFLVLELDVEDSNSSGRKQTIREIRVPLSEVESVTYHRGWFRSKMVVRARTLRALADVPGNVGGVVFLRIRRGDRARAQEMVSAFSVAATDQAVAKVLGDEV